MPKKPAPSTIRRPPARSQTASQTATVHAVHADPPPVVPPAAAVTTPDVPAPVVPHSPPAGSPPLVDLFTADAIPPPRMVKRGYRIWAEQRDWIRTEARRLGTTFEEVVRLALEQAMAGSLPRPPDLSGRDGEELFDQTYRLPPEQTAWLVAQADERQKRRAGVGRSDASEVMRLVLASFMLTNGRHQQRPD